MQSGGPEQQNATRRTLFLLTCVFAIAQMDRHILSLLLDPISLEFSLNDWQLGLLSGLAFVAVFVFVGFPVAFLAARWNRRNIVAGSVAVWSMFTLVMGFAQSFAQLFLTRMGVGAGEAGAMSPAHSMIADMYPPEKRTTALSIFAAGGNVGALLAVLLGGVGAHFLGWRWALILAGVPGLVLALLLMRFAIEPKRSDQAPTLTRALFLTGIWSLITQRDLRLTLIAFTCAGIALLGAVAYVPTIMVRKFEMNLAEIGLFLAVAIGLGGAVGTYLCGRLIDAVGARHPHRRMWMVAGLLATHVIFSSGFFLAQDKTVALGLYMTSALTSLSFWGATFAYVYGRIEAQSRTLATAVFIFAFNLLGAVIGPPLAGALSTAIMPGTAGDALAYAVLALTLFQLVAIYLYIAVGFGQRGTDTRGFAGTQAHP